MENKGVYIMGYTTEELFGNVEYGSKQYYALKQKFRECVECGWTEKVNFIDEEEIVCEPCVKSKLARID